jgi:hypothetical protein
VDGLWEENTQLKRLVAEFALKNRVLKKSDRFEERVGLMTRYSQAEKMDIIPLVEISELPIASPMTKPFGRNYGRSPTISFLRA